MADLDTLRPEVRSALGAMVRADVCRDSVPTDAFDTIRAELLRLATIEADALIALDCEHDWQVEHKRAEKAEAKLLRLEGENARLRERVSDTEHFRDVHIRAAGIFRKRAEAAEAELAALKARIFQGVVLDVDDLARGHAGLPSEWRGKRVRLVVEE